MIAAGRDNAGASFALTERDETRGLAVYDALFASDLAGICVFGPGGAIIHANDYFLRLHGLDNWTSKSWGELTAPEHRCMDVRALAEVRASGRSAAYEKECLRPDGSRILVQSTLTESIDGEIVCLSVDRTPKLEAQAALLELESFAYSVAHDLRAPLRVMSGFARELETDHASSLNARGLHCLDRIRNGARRMGVLIEDVLHLSRLAPLRTQRADVSAMAREIVAEQEENGVTFVIEDGLYEAADPKLLRIALTNLIGNAVKYTAAREDPRVEIGRVGEELYVRDNGAGFDSATASASLFAPFQRFHLATEFEGHGIGLSIVERIVRRHRGSIRAESRPGEGATFFFSLGGGR
ncbi:MAG TPA: ATP-binding protein [Thermoanaerobaculia bacterium]|jgi:PAS domain S-box-containing protein